MDQPLDLCITLTLPPPAALPDVLAAIDLCCETLSFSHTGDLLTDPLTQRERRDLQWYLEEYWMWPYEGFARRGKETEALLASVGKRLYQALFGSTQAAGIMQTWSSQQGRQHQISIVSDVPAVLSLPWELLHDDQGFLALRVNQPVSIVRRLPLSEQSSHQVMFVPPLRILLVTSQPEGTGFVDPRGVARELSNELQFQSETGTIELEFLRPPTLAALGARLKDRRRPIHILHFDGHGVFDHEGTGQGMLVFENTEGQIDAVEARVLAQILQDSHVRLVVLTACQSAMGSEEDSLSSVAAQLIRHGVDAVVAMSFKVLVASTIRYTQAFYRALAAGTSVSLAHEQARQALYHNPHRHLQQRHHDKAGAPIQLYDWWVPHLYQQRAVSLQLTQPAHKPEKRQILPLSPRLDEEMPAEPRYGFSGRARELLRLERWLLQGKVVVVSGFGGIGKTALAREAADWLTRTKMYDRACFVSFEHGGDAATLLSALGRLLGIYDGRYDPNHTRMSLARLEPFLKKERILLIADNLESILPGGEAPLEAEMRTQLWDVLFELARSGAGILLTSRDTVFSDERFAFDTHVAHLPLRGLRPTDGYMFATRLLDDLGIDPLRAPYSELRDLLVHLDHHPLAIQLVLPLLKEVEISTIRTELASFLPEFVDDTEAGHNRSLFASLEYSFRRLDQRHQSLLSLLVPFEGGANEETMLHITQIPEDEWVTTLRPVLERAGLLVAEHIPGYTELHSRIFHPILNPYLRFHPVLTPFLRSQIKEADHLLEERYAFHYGSLIEYLHLEDNRNPRFVRKLVQRELANFQHAFELWLKAGDLEKMSVLAERIAYFLDIPGFYRRRDELRRQAATALAAFVNEGQLTFAEYTYRNNLVDQALKRGDIQAGCSHLDTLLKRFEVQPENRSLGRNSYEHGITLDRLAQYLSKSGKSGLATERLREALAIITTLREYLLGNQYFIHVHCMFLVDLGDVLRIRGEYAQSETAYREALEMAQREKNARDVVVCLGQLGTLALVQRNYATARLLYTEELKFVRKLNEPAMEGDLWYQLGLVAFDQGDLVEAERCYRESIAITERLEDDTATAMTCNGLAMIAQQTERPSEAEHWLKRALTITEQKHPQSDLHATVLNNLAFLLTQELRAGHLSHTPAAQDARHYALQALAIAEASGATTEVWRPLNVLADIAELEGKVEEAREYRHRVRKTFAAFKGNRTTIDHIFSPLIQAIVAAVQGDAEVKSLVDVTLPFETQGFHVTDAIQRLCAGERDWYRLTDDMDPQSALIILRVLETLSSLTIYNQTREDGA